MIGKTIGRYRIVELLGRGGMAEVYKAYQASLDRHVAMKLMHSFLAEDKDFFERFTREAKNVAALNHPNVIQIYDFDQQGDTTYMVMEYIDGGTLKDRLEKLHTEGQRLPLDESIRIIKEVGAALSYAHKRGMIHRDVKPANVMIDSAGRVTLTDFGIAKIVSGAKFTASGSILGTPSYMAPEQGLGQPGDARADIYSLGVMLYQLVTGRLPYEADTPVAVILKHVNEQLPPPRALNPTLPQGVENIIIKALAKNPAQRYQSVDEMLAHLDDLRAASRIDLPADSTVNTQAGIRADPGATVYSGGQTGQLTTGGKLGGATQLLPKEKERRPNLLLAILGGVVLFSLITVVGVLAVGGIVMLTSATPTTIAQVSGTPAAATATEIKLSGSATVDILALALTAQAGTSAAQAKTLEALQATATPTATPDLTETAAACVPEATIAQQNPKDGSNIILNKETKVTLTISNTGQCAWADQATFNFVEGDSIHTAASASVHIPATDPGKTADIAITLKPTKAATYKSTWQIKLADGKAISQPIVLTYKAAAAVTVAPPRATFTPVPVNTPTSESRAITGASPTFFSCSYVQNTTDYSCLTNITVGGGVEPFTITIDGDSSTTKTGITSQNTYFFQLRGRRCIERLFSYQIIDATGAVFNGNGSFDPFAHKLFNNNTEICSLGG